VNKVLQLRTVIGKYKIDEEGTRRPFLIAQDVQAVLPEAVQSQKDECWRIFRYVIHRHYSVIDRRNQRTASHNHGTNSPYHSPRIVIVNKKEYENA
jgi:hypothetical protein